MPILTTIDNVLQCLIGQLDVSRAVFPSPGVAACRGFAAQAKPVRFKSAGASALHTLPFGFNPGDAMGMQGIGV